MLDRISSLCDEVLCHILSFLPTEEAAATCVLSKRWKPLWTSVPVLDYDDEIYLRNEKHPSCFERFVYATILAKRVPITRFRLKYGISASELSYADVSHARSNTDVNVWLNTAIQRGIENLDIEIHPRKFIISLSSCIFSCRTLVVLKLAGLSLNAFSSVELPSLRTLHLDLVKFVGPNYLIELLYGCPMLEDLKAQWMCYAVYPYDRKEEFKCLHLPKLVRAHLGFLGMGDTNFNILLKAICNVEFLSIDQHQFVDEVPEVPEFPRLRHLDLYLGTHNWNAVLLMLKNCPKVQSFKLDMRRSLEAVDVLPCPHFIVHECLTSHLKECYLKFYQGTQSDLQFAKYIMQNSTFLQSMKIQVSHNPLTQLERIKELALCPRRSAFCELSFD